MNPVVQPRCDELRASLVAYTSGELEALERQRVQAHLQHCKQCCAVHGDIEVGLTEAKGWRPQVSPAHLEHLNARLQPYLPAQRPGWGWFRAGALTGVGLVAVTLLVIVAQPDTAIVPRASPPVLLLAPVLSSSAVVQQQPSRYLNLVASLDWDGKVEGAATDMSISMSSGFAVFAFEGGSRRRLRVSAPNVLVEVVGTRFFVESAAGATKVGVAEGRVRVLTGNGSRLLERGETLAIGTTGDGSDALAVAHLNEPFLLHRHAATHAATKGKAKRLKKRPAAIAPTEDLLDRMTAAEELVRLGEYKAAILTYREIAQDKRPEIASFRDLSRYEIARIWGFKLGEIRRAQSMLRPLATRGNGEVQQQASLALCELVLTARPCQARACLNALAQGADVQLAVEAKRLSEHWGLVGLKCEN